MIESPAFERLLHEAVAKGMADGIADEALRSPQLQRTLEDVMSGPLVRNVLARQTRSLWTEVAAGMRLTARRLDARLVLRRYAPGRYSGLASRGTAAAADLLLAHVLTLIAGAGYALIAWLFGIDASAWVLGPVVGGGWLIVLGSYFVFFWSTVGQTPGMRALRLRVTTAEGGRLRVRRSLLRFLVAVVTLAPLFAGLLPVLVDERRRAIHDFAARTLVVYEEPEPYPSVEPAGASSAASTS